MLSITKLRTQKNDLSLDSGNVEVNKALDSVVVQMHSTASHPSTGSVHLVPVFKAMVTVERELVEILDPQ